MQRLPRFFTLLGFLAISLATGCQSYVNSTAGAEMRAKKVADFSHPLIARAYNAKPTIHFPATIGLAPQGDDTQKQLRSLDASGKLDAWKSLPHIAGVVNVSSLVYSDADGQVVGPDGKPSPVWNKSDLLLREAAARLHADAVLILKIETTVTDGKVFTPLTLLSLGLLPNNRSEVIATALAALVDTRTGYIYATVERSAGKTCYASSWNDTTRDRTMERAGRLATEKMFGDFPAVWSGVVAKHRK